MRQTKTLLVSAAVVALLSCIAVTPSAQASTTSPSSIADYTNAILAASKVNALPNNLTPTMANVTEKSVIYSNGCHQDAFSTSVPSNCVFGDPKGSKTIWLVGDSHAAQWFYTMDAVAKRMHAKLVVHTRSSCPFVDGALENPVNHKAYPQCTATHKWIEKQLAIEHPAVIVSVAFSGILNKSLAGYLTALPRLRPLTQKLIVLGDTPYQGADAPSCLTKNARDITQCSRVPSAAFNATVDNALKASAGKVGYAYIDTHSWFCTSSICPPIVNNIQLYRDDTHLTGVAAKWYSQRLWLAISSATK